MHVVTNFCMICTIIFASQDLTVVNLCQGLDLITREIEIIRQLQQDQLVSAVVHAAHSFVSRIGLEKYP
jgi:hypothetical protein